MKNQKGITLIALVITIIVLLILAAVSITALTDEDKGVVTKAKQAASKTESAADEEDEEIQEIIDYADSEMCSHETIFSEYVPNSTGTLELHKKCENCGEVIDTVSYEGDASGEVYYYVDYTDGITHIWGNGVLSQSDSLVTEITSHVKIYDGVTSISTNAFRGCSSLESVEIPASVTLIGNYAFQGCATLTTVKYYGLVAPTASSNAFTGTSVLAVLVPKDYQGSVFAGVAVRAELE